MSAPSIEDRPNLDCSDAGRLPAAIVLETNGTALATARCLADAGIDVHIASLRAREPARDTRCATVVDLTELDNDEPGICAWLAGYARTLGGRPVVIATSDATVLMLEKHRAELRPFCRIFGGNDVDLTAIVSKDRLYQAAQRAGVTVIPMLLEPDLYTLQQWCARQAAPYLVKPYFSGIKTCTLKDKNRVFPNSEALARYVDNHGSRSLIVQRQLPAADGHVFDCYGLCASDGRVVTMASHRRLRQYPPDRGATCYGEIPAGPAGLGEEALFTNTQTLLGTIHYHGIFGIEWFHEPTGNQLYLLDFNARPFSSVGHLADCGLNLPLLAYRELVGHKLDHWPPRLPLEHKYWVDFLNDCSTFYRLREHTGLGWRQWLASLSRVRSFAYWRWSDPRPSLQRAGVLVSRGSKRLLRRSQPTPQ